MYYKRIKFSISCFEVTYVMLYKVISYPYIPHISMLRTAEKKLFPANLYNYSLCFRVSLVLLLGGLKGNIGGGL